MPSCWGEPREVLTNGGLHRAATSPRSGTIRPDNIPDELALDVTDLSSRRRSVSATSCCPRASRVRPDPDTIVVTPTVTRAAVAGRPRKGRGGAEGCGRGGRRRRGRGTRQQGDGRRRPARRAAGPPWSVRPERPPRTRYTVGRCWSSASATLGSVVPGTPPQRRRRGGGGAGPPSRRRLKRRHAARRLVAEVTIDRRAGRPRVPPTYMNLSGQAAAALVRRFGIEDPRGSSSSMTSSTCRPGAGSRSRTAAGSPATTGSARWTQHLQTRPTFLRVRLGVGNPRAARTWRVTGCCRKATKRRAGGARRDGAGGGRRRRGHHHRRSRRRDATASTPRPPRPAGGLGRVADDG